VERTRFVAPKRTNAQDQVAAEAHSILVLH
jgi:hypothetical protein